MTRPPTLAESYESGDFPAVRYGPVIRLAPPPPEPSRVPWVVAAACLLVGVALGWDQLKVMAFGPPPAFTVVSQTCEPEIPEITSDLVTTAVRALIADRAVVSEVRLRNSGGAGPARVVVDFAQSEAPRRVRREETVWLGAGEERALAYRFPEYVAGADAGCGATLLPAD